MISINRRLPLPSWLNPHLSNYAIIGLCALALELALFSIFILFLPVLIANLIAVGSGMLFSFTLNARLNFVVSDKLAKRFFSYALVVGLGYLLGSSLIMAIIWLGSPAMIAKLISLPFVFLLQYNLNKNFAFKKARA